MHFLGNKVLGIIILVLLGMLVLIKQLATGSILEPVPRSSFRAWLTNVFNLLFLLVVNPLAAVLLLGWDLEAVDPSHVVVAPRQLLLGLEVVGLVFYGWGFHLIGWALVKLGGNYQLGGSSPRAGDEMVVIGPYRLVRHPMYAAVLSISLGLALLTQSLAFFGVFCIYLVLILGLIPLEEAGLQQSYREQYRRYQQKVKKLVPYLY